MGFLKMLFMEGRSLQMKLQRSAWNLWNKKHMYFICALKTKPEHPTMDWPGISFEE